VQGRRCCAGPQVLCRAVVLWAWCCAGPLVLCRAAGAVQGRWCTTSAGSGRGPGAAQGCAHYCCCARRRTAPERLRDLHSSDDAVWGAHRGFCSHRGTDLLLFKGAAQHLQDGKLGCAWRTARVSTQWMCCSSPPVEHLLAPLTNVKHSMRTLTHTHTLPRHARARSQAQGASYPAAAARQRPAGGRGRQRA